MLRLTAVVLICAVALPAWGGDEGDKEVTYKVGLDAESVAEVAKVLEGYTEGPLGIYYEGAVNRQVIYGRAGLIACELGFVLGVAALAVAPRIRDDETLRGVLFGIGIVLIAGALLLGVMEVLPRYVAPEYYAIRDIISSLR